MKTIKYQASAAFVVLNIFASAYIGFASWPKRASYYNRIIPLNEYKIEQYEIGRRGRREKKRRKRV